MRASMTPPRRLRHCGPTNDTTPSAALGAPSRAPAVSHGHYKTITLVAGLRLRGLVAQKVFDRPMNAALFEEWVEKCLVPTLSQGDIVVMDNLSAHKGARVEQLIKSAGAELRYLPPYRPDMNPIEKAISKLKAYLRKIAERTVAGLIRALAILSMVRPPCMRLGSACPSNPRSYLHERAGHRLSPRI